MPPKNALRATIPGATEYKKNGGGPVGESAATNADSLEREVSAGRLADVAVGVG